MSRVSQDRNFKENFFIHVARLAVKRIVTRWTPVPDELLAVLGELHPP